jgi:hypothetical protein
MKTCLSAVILVGGFCSVEAFLPQPHRAITPRVWGYLDDLSKEVYAPDATPDINAESREATKMDKEKLDRYGPGDFSQFVDFHEFDGGGT